MIKLSLSEITNHLGLHHPTHDATFCGISTDTRTIFPGNLFVAIRGENFDGHQFVEEAFKKGASAALVDHHIHSDIPQLVVDDTILTLGKISFMWRNHFSLPLIGVTGSNGKTTLKNMIASILRAACKDHADSVLATEGNLNNNIGLPLSLARLNEKHRYGVIEMGMNNFGEIAYLTQLVKPKIAVINNAAPAHIEYLKDVAGVARAKGEIFLGLQKNGIAILNKDDPFFSYWRGLVKSHHYLSFGLENAADVTATFSENNRITLKTPQGEMEIQLPLLGKHNVMNALAATATALALEIDLTAIKKGLENVQPAPGRLRQHHLPHDVCVIDDTYNANPGSVVAAIHALATMPGKKILVLGDMRELGPDGKQLHSMIGTTAQKAGIDYLFTLGELSNAATTAFGKQSQHFSDHEKLIVALKPHLKSQITILVKGSRSMKMEKILNGVLPKKYLEDLH